MKLRIGSRGSQLALWQANHIAELLRVQGHEVEIIKTTGDRLQEVTFAEVGSKGMFTKEIEEALAASRIDLAVHSLKDLPTELPPSFALAATPPRVDPRDVFVSVNHASLAELPRRARVGTSSQRRRAQLSSFAATSIRACASSPRARSTRFCSPPQDSIVSAKPIGCASASILRIFARLPARVHSPLKFAAAMWRRLLPSPSLTTPTRASLSRPSARPSPLSAADARFPSEFIADRHLLRTARGRRGMRSLASSLRLIQARSSACTFTRRSRTPIPSR
jgi:hypothetical protein